MGQGDINTTSDTLKLWGHAHANPLEEARADSRSSWKSNIIAIGILAAVSLVTTGICLTAWPIALAGGIVFGITIIAFKCFQIW